MKRAGKIVLAVLLIVGMMAVVGCGGQQDQQEGDKQGADKPKLLAGTNATFPPFEMQEGNDYTGFDMDLIRAIGEAQGYEVEIKHMDFKALIPALNTSKIDVAIAGMTIDEERKKSVDFTEPYFDAGLIIAVSNDNEEITTVEDLKGKRLAAQTGTTGAGYCAKVKSEDPATEVRNFDDIGPAFMELQKGGVDAVVNDHPVTAYYLKSQKNSKVKMVGDVFSAEEQYGIAVKKGNAEMLNMMNEGLAKIKADGTYDQLYSKWFD
ncbi:basic amino acid ABC transporter substrate-binding protein [Syntrophomonas erecta]